MREILFRGQCLTSKKWVEGHLIYFKSFPCIRHLDSAGFYHEEYVIPETVGQYTGLTDKNGKKIFEGDIVRMERGLMANGEYAYCDVCKVIYDHCCFFVVFADGCRRTRLYREGGTERYEIIGNIHDNPELIGGEPE